MAIYKGHNEDSSGNLLLSIGNGMTATVETGSTASQAYTKGAYIFFNNRFCKATTAITSGATLAIGTNLSETTVGQELTNHLRSSDGNEFYFDVKDGAYGYYPSASKVASEFVPFGGTGLEPGDFFGIYEGNQGNILDTYETFTGFPILFICTKGLNHLMRTNAYELSRGVGFTETSSVRFTDTQGRYQLDYDISEYDYVGLYDGAGANNKQWKVTK